MKELVKVKLEVPEDPFELAWRRANELADGKMINVVLINDTTFVITARTSKDPSNSVHMHLRVRVLDNGEMTISQQGRVFEDNGFSQNLAEKFVALCK